MAQTAQANAWYAAQTAEKRARLEEARLAKAAHADLLRAQEQYQTEAADAQAAARRAHAKNVAEENAALASARRAARGAAPSRGGRGDRRAIAQRERRVSHRGPDGGDIRAGARAARAPRPLEGRDAAERQEVAERSARSARRARADAAAAAADARAASHHENTRRALEMNAERVEQFRAEQRAAVLATVLGQRAEKHEGDAADRAERYQTGRFGDAYFAKFGASAR